MGHVIYLTGAPATGKSTLAQLLTQRIEHFEIWDYGARLLEFLSEKHRREVSYVDLRASSGALVTPADINAVDERLVAWSAEVRQRGHGLIDTHAVTKEDYGFRVTPFSTEGIARLRPTMLVCLYVEPAMVRARIGRSPEGRILPTEFEAALHVSTQVSVVTSYAIALGAPAYILRADDQEALLQWFESRMVGQAG